jgi:hypothetical protein
MRVLKWILVVLISLIAAASLFTFVYAIYQSGWQVFQDDPNNDQFILFYFFLIVILSFLSVVIHIRTLKYYGKSLRPDHEVLDFDTPQLRMKKTWLRPFMGIYNLLFGLLLIFFGSVGLMALFDDPHFQIELYYVPYLTLFAIALTGILQLIDQIYFFRLSRRIRRLG